ncbi:hypothetical protein ACWEVD_31040 [Nocardia thailandica]|uniref:HNH endonuclease n=1 Tax=Nocardia thailandica TaxID=257275 RepID=A0ABW6PPH9_9NOCA|nr:hypothetical protein [Nocardia thailandica]
MAELDDIGSETAAMMRTMLQMATLVALKSREHGQKEAEARAKAVEAKIKEAKELQLREAREAKAKDPRNIELEMMKSGPALERPGLDRSGPTLGDAMTDGVTLAKELDNPFAVTSHATESLAYDSAERRQALAAHLQRSGVSPELTQVRMLVEAGRGISPDEAIRLDEVARQATMGRDLAREARGLQRGIDRGR